MKNYEKYADEIKGYKGTHFCKDFIARYILKSNDCTNVGCARCKMLQMIWLLEEYEEPETDWSKVKVDTPILVKDYEDTESTTVVWLKRYFAEYKDGLVYAWCNGRTSWNETSIYAWNYVKLAEPEVDWSKVEVDTAIYVKASKYGNWFKRHFAEYKNGKIYTWGNGLTSHDTSRMMEWKYAKLVESEVDWSKVEVDTPILVRDAENTKWLKKHFAKFKNGKVYTWFGSGTSWSVSATMKWEYAKLAEVETND